MKKNIILIIQAVLIIGLGMYSYVQRVKAQESEQIALMQTVLAEANAEQARIAQQEAELQNELAMIAMVRAEQAAREALKPCK